jgi:hypothetical protein
METISFEQSVDIDVEGLKYTMDGGADGHTLNSSIDEIIHNIIDFKSYNIKIHKIDGKLWSFQFDIYKENVNIVDKLNNGVSLFKTRGKVNNGDISKYGKGIKSSAHCIAPNGYMILGLNIDNTLKMAVYNQKIMSIIHPDTENSIKLEKLFMDITNYDKLDNKGFLIISMDNFNLSETINTFSEKCLNECEEYDYEIDGEGNELMKHIDICYNPHLSALFDCDDEYINQNNINIFYNNEQIKGFSHTRFDLEDIEDNEEIYFANEYICCVPYRIINDNKKYDYSGMYFQSDNEQFSFEVKSEDKNGNVKYAKVFKPNYIEMGLNENDIEKCIIRITKLKAPAQSYYRETYKFDKSRACSYFVYRNGVCSDKSFIPFDGEGGFLSYYCPQLRGEIYCNNDFDGIINPGANKSLIHPPEEFCIKLRNLSKYIMEEHKKSEKKKTEKKYIENKEYLILPNNKIMDINGEKVLGEMKAGVPRWNKLKGYKAADKKLILNETNNTSPILSETIEDHNDIKEKKGADFRLFTADPSSSDSTVHIISNREYDMIEKGIVKSDILDNPDELESRQKELHMSELLSVIERIKKKYKIVNNENIEIDLSEIKLLPYKPTNMFEE